MNTQTHEQSPFNQSIKKITIIDGWDIELEARSYRIKVVDWDSISLLRSRHVTVTKVVLQDFHETFKGMPKALDLEGSNFKALSCGLRLTDAHRGLYGDCSPVSIGTTSTMAKRGSILVYYKDRRPGSIEKHGQLLIGVARGGFCAGTDYGDFRTHFHSWLLASTLNDVLNRVAGAKLDDALFEELSKKGAHQVAIEEYNRLHEVQ